MTRHPFTPRWEWTRYWRNEDERTPYLPDGLELGSEMWFSGRRPNGLCELDDLLPAPPERAPRRARLLVLLGQPGAGKSTELRRWLERQRDLGAPARLAELSSTAQMHRALDDWPEELLAAPPGSSPVLLLDGLDEARRDIGRLGRELADRLERLPTRVRDRLTVALTCRTGVWGGYRWIGRRVAAALGVDRAETYVLTVLAHQDVRAAASAELGSSRPFMAALQSAEVTALAAQPLTLALLLKLFKRPGGLPKTRTEVFARCLRVLASEVPERHEIAGVGAVGDDARLAVAQLLAVVSLLSGKEAIWTGEPADAGEMLSLTEALPGESAQERAIAGDLVHWSQLFSARGDETFAWTNRGVMEHLAAAELRDRMSGSGDRICDLLSSPLAPRGRLIPQLRGVAAILAPSVSEVFEQARENEPEVLLQADGRAMADEQRSAVVAAVIRVLEGSGGGSADPAFGADLSRFRHPGLEAQIRPVLQGRSTTDQAQAFAAQLAGACTLTGLAPELLRIASGTEEDRHSRCQAAHALARVDDRPSLDALAKTVSGEPIADDDVLGAILGAVWPKHLPPEELIPALRPPRTGITSLYSLFLRDLAQTTSMAGLPLVIDWLADQLRPPRPDRLFVTLSEGLLGRAWESVDSQEDILGPLCRTVLNLRASWEEVRLGPDETPRTTRSQARRRRVLTEAVRLLATKGNEVVGATHLLTDWLRLDEDEATWMEERRNSAQDSVEQDIWREFGRLTTPPSPAETHPDDQRRREALELRRKEDELAAEKFRETTREIVLGTAGREKWLRLLGHLRTPNPLQHEALVQQGGRVRDGVIDAARSFLAVEHAGGDGPDLSWATRAAFLTLSKAGSERVEAVDPEVWKRAASALVLWPTIPKRPDVVTKKLAEHAEPEAAKALMDLVDLEDADWSRRIFFWRDSWLPAIGRPLLTVLEGGRVPSDSQGELLRLLLREMVPGATDVALRWLVGHDERPPRAIDAGAALLLDGPPSARPQVWSELRGRSKFGVRVIEAVADRGRMDGPSIDGLSPSDVGRAYDWMYLQFPPSEDGGDLAGPVPPRFSIGRWRDRLLEHLRTVGTLPAVEEVKRLVQDHPERSWLSHTLQAAEEARRQANPGWITPAEVHRALESPHLRPARSSAELREAVVAWVGTLQAKLASDSRLRGLFLNGEGDPVDERKACDLLELLAKGDLHAQAIRVLQEVQVKRPQNSTGMRIDLLFWTGPEEDPTGTCAVEVKGDWNKEWFTSMREQLAERYLTGTHHRHGIHLLIWTGTRLKRREANLSRLRDEATLLSTGPPWISSVMLDITEPSTAA